jgi:hypothetical protein
MLFLSVSHSTSTLVCAIQGGDTMNLISNAATMPELLADVVRFVELRAELHHSAIHTTTSSKLKDQYRHAEQSLLQLAGDLKKLKIEPHDQR